MTDTNPTYLARFGKGWQLRITSDDDLDGTVVELTSDPVWTALPDGVARAWDWCYHARAVDISDMIVPDHLLAPVHMPGSVMADGTLVALTPARPGPTLSNGATVDFPSASTSMSHLSHQHIFTLDDFLTGAAATPDSGPPLTEALHALNATLPSIALDDTDDLRRRILAGMAEASDRFAQVCDLVDQPDTWPDVATRLAEAGALCVRMLEAIAQSAAPVAVQVVTLGADDAE